MRTIVIGCDNAAVHLKNELMDFMEKRGHTAENMGYDSTEDSTYYPYVAKKVYQEIINSGYQKRDVLIYSTGLGIVTTTDKFKGTRVDVCHDISSAGRLRLNNGGDMICMDERVIGTELAKRVLEKWLELDFVDCASTSEVEAIKEIGGENLK